MRLAWWAKQTDPRKASNFTTSTTFVGQYYTNSQPWTASQVEVLRINLFMH